MLGWPGYRVFQQEIDEANKTLKLWVRRKKTGLQLVCSGCGKHVREIHEVYEREVRDLPVFQYRTTNRGGTPSGEVSALWSQNRESCPVAEQGTVQQALRGGGRASL